MKNAIKKILAGIVTATVLLSANAYAGITVTGTGNSSAIDTAGFPAEMVEYYKLMGKKCVKCHSLERVVIAIQTGLGPISGDIFDEESSAAYGAKMRNMPDSNLIKEEVNKIVSLLNYLIEQAAE